MAQHEAGTDGPIVTLRRRYPEPVAEVWSAFTDSERLARWFGSYSGTGVPGGTVELTVTGEVDAGGTVADPVTVGIHECDAPHRLVVEIPEGTGGPTWLVEITLSADGDGTALLFERHVVPGIDPDDIAAGWNWYLDRLQATLDNTPMPSWSDYAPDRS